MLFSHRRFSEFAKLVEWTLQEIDPEDEEEAAEAIFLADWMRDLISELEEVARFEGGNLPLARRRRPNTTNFIRMCCRRRSRLPKIR